MGLYSCKRVEPTPYKPTIGLEEAIERRDERAVAYWAFEERHRPNVSFNHYITPRMLAAKVGNKAIMQSVLGMTWSNVERDAVGMTALHWATYYNQVEMAKMLIDAGYELDVVDEFLGYTPLMYAIKNKNIAMVDLLINAGADVNKGNEENFTPLMLASMWSFHPREAIVKRLLDAGAKTGKQDNSGWSALAYASTEYCPECVKLLLDAGEDVNNHYEQGAIPLLVATQHCDEKTAEVLIKAGADISVRTKDKENPLILTGRSHCTVDEDTIRVYIGNGIDVLAKDAYGYTIWDIAKEDPYMTDKAEEMLKQEVAKAKKAKIEKKSKHI